MEDSELKRGVVGVWELTDYLIHDEAGAVVPQNRQIHGRLIYSPSGHVAVVIARPPGQMESLKDVIAYSGTFSVNQGRMEHFVQVSSIPRFHGTVLIRECTLIGERLVLKTVDRPGGVHELHWKRID